MTLAIGIDVGGTKVAAGVVDEDGRIVTKLKRSTPAASPARTERAIADVVAELLTGYQVSAIGLGAAGFVDLLLDPARAAFERALTGRGHRPFAEIRKAQLGQDAGIVGAADLAREASRTADPQTTAPSSPSSGPPGPGSFMRSTSMANPATNAATAQKAASPDTDQPAAVATTR
jgi:predicted NBD/HSP70 family sugar kinase